MGNADKYQANAIHCFQMANKASDPNDEQNCERRMKSSRKLSKAKELDRSRPSRDINISG